MGHSSNELMLTARFRDALIFAAQLHAGQVRKGLPIPYMSHLMAVSSIVLDHGGNENQAIAALLHDAVEDQGGKPILERIQALFGEEVARIVSGCTDSYTSPKPPWKPRKVEYLRHLREAPSEIRLVSAADKLHNARSILADYRQLGDGLWSRFKGGKAGTLWYYRELVEIFNQGGPHPLNEELGRVVCELEALVEINDQRGVEPA